MNMFVRWKHALLLMAAFVWSLSGYAAARNSYLYRTVVSVSPTGAGTVYAS